MIARARSVGACLIAIALLAVCVWTVVPGWNIPTLLPQVLVPEIAPFVFAAVVVFGALAVVCAPPRRTRRIVAVVVACSGVLALLPIASYLLDPALPKIVNVGAILRPASARGVRIERDIVFARRPSGVLRLDVYHAPGVHRAPAAIAIYGGAWRFGDRGSDRLLHLRLAQTGVTVIAIEYRLVPVAIFPAQRDDVDAGIAYVARHARALDVDPTRIVLVGRSAGAQLALLAAYRPQPLALRGVAAFYAPSDLTDGYRVRPVPDPIDVRSVLVSYIGAPLTQATAARYREASPTTFAHGRVVPTLLVSGDRDDIVRVQQQRALAALIRATPGNRVVAEELPWSGHAFDEVPNGMGAQVADHALDAWLATVLRPSR